MSQNIKQVIVVRTDLSMRRGKEDSQCGHAALAPWGRQIQGHLKGCVALWNCSSLEELYSKHGPVVVPLSIPLHEALWFLDIYTKITLAADSEAELLEVKRLYEEAGIPVHLVVDAGLTEIPPNTPTCLCAGPWLAEDIDKITGREGVHPLRLR